MLTTVHTLTFPDGESVQARASFESPQDRVPVSWSGSVERVPTTSRLASADVGLLRVVLKRLGLTLGAEWNEVSEGSFDFWAE